MKIIEATGKKLDDAINEGLSQLGGVGIDDVDVEILCSGSWLRKAKVRITFDDEAYEKNGRSDEDDEIISLGAVTEENAGEKPARFERKRRGYDGGSRRERPRREKAPEYAEAQPEVSPVRSEPAEPPKPVSEEQTEMARKYLTELLKLMDIEATLVINTDKGRLDIDIVTEDTAVIGHHGEVLDAIQQLSKRAVEEGEDKHLSVRLDCKGYREHREKTLISMANRMAAKAIRTGRKVALEPMNNSQRKIIHAALNDNDRVFTKSEGKEPARRVVIIPKRGRRRYDREGRNFDRKTVAAQPADSPETDNE